MNKQIKYIILFITIVVNLSAVEVSEKNREREHSVKEVIQTVGQLEDKNSSSVENILDMFENNTILGQVKIMSSKHKIDSQADPYATAIGGKIKYELGVLNGFNAGVAFITAQDISFLTGENTEHNPNLSSEKGAYTEVSQAFVNYKYKDVNLRLGRQLIDTPFADSDDIRMINNTFEAAIITYELDEFTATLGYLDRWQGVDAGLDVEKAWQDTGSRGTYLGSVTYKSPLLDASIWYYDISKTDENTNTLGENVANKTLYADISLHANLTKEYYVHLGAQYINQSEVDKSAIASEIYGLMGEFVIMENFSFSVAYNLSEKKPSKRTFSGFGGGTLYTNMDIMILNDIAVDREAQVVVTGITYKYKKFGFLYAYGNFKGDKDSLGKKENIIEQDFGVEYIENEDLTIAALYRSNKDTQNTQSDYKNYRIVATYNF